MSTNPLTKRLNPVFGDRTRRSSAAFRTRLPTRQTSLSLNYDPQPRVRNWRGNWLPPCYYPLSLSDASARIARCVWWNGPPWTVLRNSSYFLWRVWDYATPEQLDYVRRTVARDAWLRANRRRRPGRGVARRNDALGVAPQPDRADGLCRLARHRPPARLPTAGQALQGTIPRPDAVLERAIRQRPIAVGPSRDRCLLPVPVGRTNAW